MTDDERQLFEAACLDIDQLTPVEIAALQRAAAEPREHLGMMLCRAVLDVRRSHPRDRNELLRATDRYFTDRVFFEIEFGCPPLEEQTGEGGYLSGPLTEAELNYLNPSAMDSMRLRALARAVTRQGNRHRATLFDITAMVVAELNVMEFEQLGWKSKTEGMSCS